ncbi:hypothetical protein B0H14DRAFT_2609386 [Mycena olivaceomarginata]|nr:hypothetical protein B0H14DRAFT_2609386 [Mycena olivaceomarginata]
MAPIRNPSATSSVKFFTGLTPPPSPKAKRVRKIRWYLDQRGQMSTSRPTLVKRQRVWRWSDDVDRDLLDVTDPRFHIFSATTLPELLAFLPACQEFANQDFEYLQATGQIYYAVEKHPKTFTNIDEATAAWEACREKVKSRVMLATADPESAQWFTLPNV